ncbi:MAG TPA: glycosyl hydrolase family 18 protein [Anaerohalosphaeraceae bacterium]|nr:glycosyl hydrolase family 18 protein [Anaerohalosphaeraceae bacterium]
MSRLILSCMAAIVVLLSSCVPPTQTPDIQQPGQTGTPTVPPVVEEPPLSANPPSMSFIHGCYVHGRRIGDINQLRQSRLDQFNILYLIAGPDWKPTDFDLSSSEAIQKLVHNHTYPAGQTGLAMAPELLRRAHKSGVKTLLSIQDGEFLPLAQNPHRRACFAKVMTAFVRKYGFDGIEIDWESDFDLPLHAALMADIRHTLNELSRSTSRYYYLATALMAGKKYSADLAAAPTGSIS